MTITKSLESVRLERTRKRLAIRPGTTVAGPILRDIELLVARAQKRLIDRSGPDLRASA